MNKDKYLAHKEAEGWGTAGGGSYTWDGKQFVLTLSFHTGMCRAQLGGFWMLPTTVDEINNVVNVKP